MDAGSADAGSPTHVLINFDDLPACTVVSIQYASHVTFSGDNGATTMTEDLSGNNLGQSPPNCLTSFTGGCLGNSKNGFHMMFKHPVNNLKFNAIGVESNGSAATLQITHGSQLSTEALTGNGVDTVPVSVDLSNYVGVTNLDIVLVTDPGGFGLDDLAFDEP